MMEHGVARRNSRDLCFIAQRGIGFQPVSCAADKLEAYPKFIL